MNADDVYRIVLADDHALIRHGIKKIISQDEGLEIAGEVADGEALMAYLENDVPDMVILDISMPKVSGIDLAEQVKQMHPGIKILMLTMHKNKQFFYGAMAAGADGYLVKSDSDKELLLAVNKIRGGRTYISPYLADDFTEDVLGAYRNQEVNPFKGLTKREKQILKLVVDGLTSKDIAEKLNLSPRTVDHHRANLLKKFRMKNSVDLVNYAIRNGYVTVE
ncbi:MAG: DNA-binding response regulator [Proteobacteria bacterium]|nr:MAG: DNA-binding response regulator [Pseudomonadota bacterium]PIE65262.1 MAG: DNA-binding response regulator [Desulfobacterales bacterium]